jgi:hypothetical protein
MIKYIGEMAKNDLRELLNDICTKKIKNCSEIGIQTRLCQCLRKVQLLEELR